MWNSVGALKIIKKRLCDISPINGSELKFHIYDEAGHNFYTPFIFPVDNTYGGKRLSNFKANEQFWKDLVRFLNKK